MKTLLKVLLDTEGQLSHVLLMVGVCCAFIFGVMGLSYIRGELVMEEGRAMLDVTTLTTGMGGKITYLWLGIVLMWLPLYILRGVITLREMWKHGHRDAKQAEEFLRPLWRAIRGEG